MSNPSMLTDLFPEGIPAQSIVPTFDVNDEKVATEMLNQLGESTFRNAASRSIERDWIERTSRGISIAGRTAVSKRLNDFIAVITGAVKGGVEVKYPVDSATADTGEMTAMEPLVHDSVRLSRGNVTYRITHETVNEGGSFAENDLMREAANQLADQTDFQYLKELKAKAYTNNNKAVASNKEWDTAAGKIFDDLNEVSANIVDNSALRPEQITQGSLALIVPVNMFKVFRKYSIIDNIKTTMEDQIKNKLGITVMYSRNSWHYKGATWPLGNDEAILIPVKDPYVGKFYTYDGGRIPTTFVTVTENGKRVSSNYWMAFKTTFEEKDGGTTFNRRIAHITNIHS